MCKIADHVSLCGQTPALRVLHLAGPKCNAVIVFGREYDIPSACILEQLRPCVRVALCGPCIELCGKAVVIEVLALVLDVVLVSGGAFDSKRVQVPLCIRVIAEPDFGTDLSEFAGRSRLCRNRVKAPVNENPELRVLVSLRNRVAA
jgi:hypothetical protein